MPNLGIARLSAALRDGQTVVTDQYSQAPLQLHRALTLKAGAPPVVYLKTPSSGLLEGDEHRIDINLASGSVLELRTQASTLVYPGRSQHISNYLVSEDAKLIFHPHPIILAKDADFIQKVTIELANRAALDYQEEWCTGRIAMGESWLFASYKYELEILVEKRLAYRERWHISPCEHSLEGTTVCGDFTHFRSRYLFNLPQQEQEIETALPIRNNCIKRKTWSVVRDNGIIIRDCYC